MTTRLLAAFFVASGLVAACAAEERSAPTSDREATGDEPAFKRFVETNCLECHDKATKSGGLRAISMR